MKKISILFTLAFLACGLFFAFPTDTAYLQNKSIKLKTEKSGTPPNPVYMAVPRQNLGGSLLHGDIPLPTNVEVDDYFSVLGHKYVPLIKYGVKLNSPFSNLQKSSQSITDKSFIHRERDVNKTTNPEDLRIRKILDAHQAVNFLGFRKMLLEKNVPFEPNLFLKDNWRDVLGKDFTNFLASLKSKRLTSGEIGGVIMADTLYLPEKMNMTSDTFILANKIVYEGTDIVISGRYNLWYGSINKTIILTKPIEGAKRSYNLPASDSNFEQEFFEKNSIFDSKLGAFSVVGESNKKLKPAERWTPEERFQRESGARGPIFEIFRENRVQGPGTPGTGGTNGNSGNNGVCPSAYGYDGQSGGDGTDGGRGDDGPSITFEPGEVPSYGNAQGYIGGPGGPGGSGGHGGDGVVCTDANGNVVTLGEGGIGSDGGYGGDGGNGGNGGTVTVKYYTGGAPPSVGQVQGGEGGTKGTAGTIGFGGRGACSGGNCELNGQDGTRFDTASDGDTGSAGIVDTQEVPFPIGGGGCFSILPSKCNGGGCTNWYWVFFVSYDGGHTWQVYDFVWAGCWF
jgi:hypothetical protein